MRINFDFTDLEVFLAVKETGSFHQAAERLNLSQSSITRRLKKLETALGSVLFERTTRDVRPTLAAKRLQMRAEAILNDVGETARAMRDENAAYAHQQARTVTIATIPTVVPDLISPAIHAVRADGHNARLRLMDLAANEVAEAVAQGEADFGICSIPMLEPSTDFELLFNDPVVLAMPASHRLAGQGQVAWSELESETLILPARGTGNRLLIDEAMARTRLPIRWTVEVGRSTTALDLVSDRIGVAPLPRSSVANRHGDAILWRTMMEPVLIRPIGLVRRLGQQESNASSALIDAIRARARHKEQ